MRNPLLIAALATVLAALGWALWPVSELPAPEAEALPPTAATSPASSRSGPTVEPRAPAALSAEQLTERAKRQLALSPAAALDDIERADQLAGTGADIQNETRRVLEIHALVRLGRVGLARTLTDRFFRTFPNSDRAAELERLTGYHPRPGRP